MVDPTGKVAALCLLLVAGALAGCAGKAGTDQSSLDQAASSVAVQATPTTGLIRGVVVDSAVRPIADARVSIKVGPQTRAANTTTTGAFGFDNLPPGTYFLEAHKRGFADTRTGVDVVAGVANPPVTKIALAPDPSSQPYVEVFVFKGFLQCGAQTPAVGFSACGVVSGANPAFDDNTQVTYTLAGNVSWAQSEMTWTATNPLGQDLALLHSYTCPGQTLFCDHGAEGSSPLAVVDNGTWVRTLGLNSGTGLYIRVFATSLNGTTPPPPVGTTCAPDPALGGQICPHGVGAVVQQDFTIYTHAFHGFVPPDGWRFSRDGDPVVPPA